MSAQAQMRAMLDQLMGTSRDGDTTRQRIKFSDDRVCKSHLLNCCPHDVLSGTRMDLGECLKVHDLALRADYEIASKEQDFFFELDAMDHLQSFIADCDRRTEVAKKRLAETQEEISAEVAAKAERVHELNEEIGKLLAKVEQLGADGNVEESQKVMDEVEKARAKKREAEEVYRNSMPASSFQQQKLRVCEVCSAYLGLHDNDRRLADHFGGKLHLGFIEIREKLEELRRVVADKQEKRNQERLKRREEREKEEREKLRRSRSHSKNPRRSRSRDRRRHRSRSASRERKRRTRSKSREKRHRHRSRSSSRSRSRSHQRSRHSSRDRSRERKKRTLDPSNPPGSLSPDASSRAPSPPHHCPQGPPAPYPTPPPCPLTMPLRAACLAATLPSQSQTRCHSALQERAALVPRALPARQCGCGEGGLASLAMSSGAGQDGPVGHSLPTSD
ncbi:Putative RNA-binding protein Luc7-like 2 [Chelonia mydas]|uniref:Putative RNA-binding protein Luc7-like 2 n=2 Tax=Durocryptodira TaxID=1579337 RepID=M7B8M2_CHEMY|nr:Putative RNA-binding protein Luc7-like 2 [Chelonia mydas]